MRTHLMPGAYQRKNNERPTILGWRKFVWTAAGFVTGLRKMFSYRLLPAHTCVEIDSSINVEFLCLGTW